MWIQDWSGKITTDFGTRVFWNWRWNETWYPDLDFVVKELDDQGVKVTVYLTGRFPTLLTAQSPLSLWALRAFTFFLLLTL